MPKSTSNKRKFFSVDCDFFWQEDTGKNYRALRSRFGNDGLMFYIYLQSQIHSTDEAYFNDCVPAADVRPERHGEWLYSEDGIWECSECGAGERNKTPYCWRCGAKMDGGGQQDNE